MKRLICTLLTLLALATATQAQEIVPERQNWRHHTLRGDVACVRMKVYTISDHSGTIRQDSLRSWYEWQFNERGDVALHTSGNTLREISLKELFTYTAEGLTESVVWHDIEQNILYKTLYRYNAEGRQSECSTHNGEGSLVSRQHYTYDSLGHLSEELSYNAEGVESYRRTYVYNSRGDKVEEHTTDRWGTRSERIALEYDGEGRIIGQELYLNTTAPISRTRYTYDAAGNRTERMEYDYDGSPSKRSGPVKI